MAFRSSPSSRLLATFILMAIAISPMFVLQSDAARVSRKLLCLICSMGPSSAMIPMVKPVPMAGPQSAGWNWGFGWSCQKKAIGVFWISSCSFDKHKGTGTGPMAGGAGAMSGGSSSSTASSGSSSSTASSGSSSP